MKQSILLVLLLSACPTSFDCNKDGCANGASCLDSGVCVQSQGGGISAGGSPGGSGGASVGGGSSESGVGGGDSQSGGGGEIGGGSAGGSSGGTAAGGSAGGSAGGASAGGGTAGGGSGGSAGGGTAGGGSAGGIVGGGSSGGTTGGGSAGGSNAGGGATDAGTGCSPGAVCRAAIPGSCDVEEFCLPDAGCPIDGPKSLGSICRMKMGDCDVAEFCDGTSLVCPVDAKLVNTTICRGADGGCDTPEKCTGTSDSCPPDAKLTAGTECRAAQPVCDVNEVCDGTSAFCPTDIFASVMTTCGAAPSCVNGVVTPVQNCNGNAAACSMRPSMACPGGYSCLNAQVCRTSCGSNAECANDRFCSGGTCLLKRVDGSACSGTAISGAECISGLCTGSYFDGDGDTFGAGPVSFACGPSVPVGRSRNNMDCCDTDARAKPGQNTPFTTPRVGGCAGAAFDFDCDGSQTVAENAGNACTSSGSCSTTIQCAGTVGWQGSVPSCGQSANYISSCRSVAATACTPFSPCVLSGSCDICNPTMGAKIQACR
jgi:hypothetical protein